MTNIIDLDRERDSREQPEMFIGLAADVVKLFWPAEER